MPVEPIRDLPIIGYYDVQRFPQFCPADCANWYIVPNTEGKKQVAMYPTLGRKHVTFLSTNQLIFAAEPRAIFKSVNYFYVVVSDKIYRVDANFNTIEITTGLFTSLVGNVFFDFLVFTTYTYACFTDGQKIYVYSESAGTFHVVTDTNAPVNPTYIATFGNRIVVSQANSSQFSLSAINLGGATFDASTCFTISGEAVFAQEDGYIQQMAVLHNTLYIFTPYRTGIWSNTPSIFSGFDPPATFPFKKNSSIDFNFGLNDPLSLSVGFNMMAWEGRNEDGLVQFMVSSGGAPQIISTKAVDVLLQQNVIDVANNPFISTVTQGFLYSYENTIFYRVSLGRYVDLSLVDYPENAFSIEYNFDAQQWNRVIEANGERCRVQKSVYFSGRHLATVEGEGTIYEISGEFYVNEIRNPLQTNPQAPDAYTAEPFRYERITPIIHEDDYAEFLTEYVEIDFVWGDQDFVYSLDGFQNTVYIADETSTDASPLLMIEDGQPDVDPVFIVAEVGNTPALNESTYNTLYKPSIELFYSDDGGISFLSADVREFSQLGVYRWRMRWYQLGTSRNRVYKLICVSPAPIVVLGAVMNVRRVGSVGH